MIKALDETRAPNLHPTTFVAPGAVVIGDVTTGEGSSIWYNAVVRGDVGFVRIGARTNIQDLAMVHMSEGHSNAIIGDDVTVGHSAIIHGATIGDGVLIGMGAIILDNAVIGEGSVVGANALVTANVVIPPRSLVLGSPAKVVKTLTEEQTSATAANATHYVHMGELHAAAVASTTTPEED